MAASIASGLSTNADSGGVLVLVEADQPGPWQYVQLCLLATRHRYADASSESKSLPRVSTTIALADNTVAQLLPANPHTWGYVTF